MVGPAPMDGIDVDMSADDVVKNVEKMLKREDAAAKAQAKKGAKVISFDLNEGVVGSIGGSKSKKVDG
jgi:hypothetical protein